MSALSIWLQSLVGKNLKSGKIMYRSEQTYLVLWYMPVTEMEIISCTKQYFSDFQIAKAVVSYFYVCLSVCLCLCLCMEQLGFHWMDIVKFDIRRLHENLSRKFTLD